MSTAAMAVRPIEILLVEDNPGDVRWVKETFREFRLQNRMDVVEDGEAALLYLHREPPYADARRPDLVLLDLNLPRKNGIEVLHAIKHDPSLHNLPVIILTASEMEREMVVREYLLPPQSYLLKPLDWKKYLEAIHSCGELQVVVARLDRAATAQEVQQPSALHEPPHAIADQAPVMIWVAGPDGRRLYFNKRWLQFSGRAAEQEAGWGWMEGVHPDDRALCRETNRANFAERREFRTEYRRRRYDGEYRWILDIAVPRNSQRGEFAGFVGSCIDVTDHRNLEESLRQKTEELTRSNADLEQFARISIHDLQEPLRMVSSFLQLLDRRYSVGRPLDSDAREFIRFAGEGARRMSELIAGLVRYFRAGRRLESLREVDTAAMIDAVMGLVMGDRTDSVVITRGHLPVISGDPEQLADLFRTLLGNAVKFRSPGRECRISVQAEWREGAWQFSIQDNGIGIAPRYADLIFQVFQRLHSRSEYPGSGIGLAVARRIVEQHGGRIWFVSTPGEGTTFYFTLPGSTPQS